MYKFHKDGNKIKKLKVRRGIPIFINFCYNQGIRNKLKNYKLFIDDNNELHYHVKWDSGSGIYDSRNTDSVQYIIKKIIDFSVESNNIIINGNIEKTKGGFDSKKKEISQISLYRIYSDEEKLVKFLNNNKIK